MQSSTRELDKRAQGGYPVKFTVQNVLIVLATVTILGFAASYIAASRVNKKLLE